MSERDARARKLYRVWSAHSHALGHTTLPWTRLGHDLREGWRLVGDAAVGLPPVLSLPAVEPPAVDPDDVGNLFPEGAMT